MKNFYLYITIIFFTFINLKVNPNNDAFKCQNRVLQQINVLHSFICGDTLNIVSDDKLIWNPYNVDSISVQSLQDKYNNVFEVKSFNNSIINLIKNDNKIIIKKNEIIKEAKNLAEHHHSDIPKYSILKSTLRSPLIELQHGIKVGMDKTDFFKLIKKYSNLENKISVIVFFDPLGDFIKQTYIFKKNRLIYIQMNKPY